MPEEQARIYEGREAYTPEEKLTTEEQPDVTKVIQTLPEEVREFAEEREPRFLGFPPTGEEEVGVSEFEPSPVAELGTPEEINQNYDNRAELINLQVDRGIPIRQELEPLNPLLTFIMLSADIYAGNMKFANYYLFQRPALQKKYDTQYQMELNAWNEGTEGRDLERSVRTRENEMARQQALLAPVTLKKTYLSETKKTITSMEQMARSIDRTKRREIVAELGTLQGKVFNNTATPEEATRYQKLVIDIASGETLSEEATQYMNGALEARKLLMGMRSEDIPTELFPDLERSLRIFDIDDLLERVDDARQATPQPTQEEFARYLIDEANKIVTPEIRE